MEPVEASERPDDPRSIHGSPVPGPSAAVPGPRRHAVGPTSADVISALTRLKRLAEIPLAGHPDVYQGVHGDLQRALAAIDGG